MPLAMMMICRTFISQTSNSSSWGSRQAREELKKGKSSTKVFSACTTYEKQLRIEKTRLSHQVWSHGGSTFKKKGH